MSIKITKSACVADIPTPIYGSLRERLEGIRVAANDAWAQKASSGFRSTAVAIGAAVHTFEVRAAEIASEEDALRLRAELADVLRSAAAAIAPRAT